MKTLFISDLDGTLLKSNAMISKESCQIINHLSDKGIFFSYATARSIYTASSVTKGLNCMIPVITKNGTFINNAQTGDILYKNIFTQKEAEAIYEILQKNNLSPIVFSHQNNREKYSYDCTKMNDGTKKFIKSHKGDLRDCPLIGDTEILNGEVHYFSCIGTKDILLNAYCEIKEKYQCIFSKDTYTDDMWLEIMPDYATKAKAAKKLQTLLGFDKIIAFGDGINDIPMFKIADECYAVDNAASQLKELATDIIDTNNNDGVAKWLKENYKKYQ